MLKLTQVLKFVPRNTGTSTNLAASLGGSPLNSVVTKRYRHEVSKATIHGTIPLSDGSKFISRVPLVRQTTTQLPPALHGPAPKYSHISKCQLDEMRALRLQDPILWTQGALAKKFNVSARLVTKAAPPSEEHKQKLKDLQIAQWNKMGFKGQLIHINRLRRRALW